MTQIASAYAQALYSLAHDEGLRRQILEQLNSLDLAFGQEPDFIRLLSAPNLSKEERISILDKSFAGRLQPYLLNFLKILTEKGYIRHFSACCEAYKAYYNEDHGILQVKAVTAVALSDEQKKRLSEKLTRMTGKQIDLICVLDPSVMGGVRLDYDGKRVDDTVRHRLDAIHSLLKSTVL